DIAAYSFAVSLVSPAIYASHPQTAIAEIEKLSQPIRDEAYFHVVYGISHKMPFSEPFAENRDHKLHLKFQEIVDMCAIARKMEYDARLYDTIVYIVDAVSSHKSNFSRNQVTDIVRLLNIIIDECLPSKRRIRHAGFRLIAQGQVSRLTDTSANAIVRLLEETKSIPNESDRIYTSVLLSLAMPGSKSSKRKQLLKASLEAVESMPILHEKLSLYEHIAVSSEGIDDAVCKEAIQRAMMVAVGGHSGEYLGRQRRLVQLAYRLDPELAASLASLADDDPARVSSKIHLAQQLKQLRLEARISDLRGNATGVDEESIRYLAEASWSLLGKLNAGRAQPSHLDHAFKSVERAVNIPISESYPVFAWFLENANMRLEQSDQASTVLRAFFDSTLVSADLALQFVSTQMGTTISRSVAPLGRLGHGTATAILVRQGEREHGIEYISSWFKKHLGGYLKVCDPYFGPSDVEMLKLVLEVNPEAQVQILTSPARNSGDASALKIDYRTYWRDNCLSQDPPDTDVMVVSLLDIHDRWWITENGGLKFGTSFNSLGMQKSSDITIMSSDEIEEHEREIDDYLSRRKRSNSGKKLTYDVFTM
ncbi:MAG: hypothetical protein ACR2OU_09435, partial [Thermomicrobiales bacterium]